MSATCLITGATGLVGSHLAEACAARGLGVRALVRPDSDASLLDGLAEVVRGDLGDADALRRAVEGADYVFHCAAKVGDWGPVEEYRRINVDALRNLLDACRGRPLKRFIELGSLGVYPAQHHYGSDESHPLPQTHMDGYTQTKVEAEKLAVAYSREHGLPLTVLRPGFIYGPRDRTLFPRLIDNLEHRRVRYIGSSRLVLNCIYVKNLVEAFFLAMDNPVAVGQVYNLTDGETVTKRRFIEAVCGGLGLPRPRPVVVPFWLAKIVARWMERRALRRGATEAPRLTQGRLKFLGLNLDFSIEKARRELGYRPPYTFDEGMRETIEWFKVHAPVAV
ncbi:MAG: NAD-dependent epimerase/dehydratase family protein [Planctomycetes bacterium]|nr:NAD-dependent epimerase/dehydratase family protein [Planctomycetota bacterium]